MDKDQVLKLIKEYQDFSKINNYPEINRDLNPDDLDVHEEVATCLREELEKNPEFFKELDEKQVKDHILKKHNDKLDQKEGKK